MEEDAHAEGEEASAEGEEASSQGQGPQPDNLVQTASFPPKTDPKCAGDERCSEPLWRFLPFEEALLKARSFEPKTQTEWFEWCQSGALPARIPAHAAGTCPCVLVMASSWGRGCASFCCCHVGNLFCTQRVPPSDL